MKKILGRILVVLPAFALQIVWYVFILGGLNRLMNGHLRELIGAFVLVMENPIQALIFLIFTVVLQLFDGYILKPKLFGNSLGVSGTLIMIAFLVGGNMFGIVGMLLSIPGIAILDMIYRDYILKGLEKRRRKKDAKDGSSAEPIEQESMNHLEEETDPPGTIELL